MEPNSKSATYAIDPNTVHASIEFQHGGCNREFLFSVAKGASMPTLVAAFETCKQQNESRITALMFGRVITMPSEMTFPEFVNEYLKDKYPHFFFTKFIFPGICNDTTPVFYYFSWNANGRGEAVRSDRTDIFIDIPTEQLNRIVDPELIKIICDAGIDLYI